MPAATCQCGGLTNSCTSNYWDVPSHTPTECYAKWENGKWVAGCAYSRAGSFEKRFADTLINRISEHDPNILLLQRGD